MPPDPLAVFGPTSKGRERRGGEGRGGEGMGQEGRGEEGGKRSHVVPVLRNDHCDCRQCINIYNSNNDGKLHKTNFS